MASPRPRSGIGMTAMVAAPEASSSRKYEKSCAAASTRSPVGLRFSAGPDVGARLRAEREEGFAGADVARIEAQGGTRRIMTFELARR